MSLLSLAKKVSGGKKRSGVPAKKKSVVKSAGREKITASAIELYPVMSEKSVQAQECGVVVFRVSHRATKRQVAQAVRDRYSVEPREIRMLFCRPKQRRRGRTIGRTAAWKKAYVKVDDVQAISTGP